MHSARCRCVTMLTLCVLAALVSAQVTFSRDWSGGKRSPPAVFDCGQFARICRHFLHELKQEMSTDDKLKHRRLEPEDIRENFEDEK
ncbi:uncharacterized protein [Maniola hyperantus]|uniref:uncharacterized protein isoform X1 n=2 Tax=Aphantopus hyperantus TaxID=2795564 RepID=UPI00156A0237|nr:uncharacterized protein LOC117983797 isoform X1 [Maniola hyperantus]